MSLLDQYTNVRPEDLLVTEDNTKSWKIDYNNKRILHKFVTESELVGQEAWGALSVERYGWYIHTDNYGVEFAKFYGKNPNIAKTWFQTEVKEALLRDERILNVDNFDVEINEDYNIVASFDVHSIYGSTREELEVYAK